MGHCHQKAQKERETSHWDDNMCQARILNVATIWIKTYGSSQGKAVVAETKGKIKRLSAKSSPGFANPSKRRRAGAASVASGRF
jgi:hypothetical protein